MENRPQDPIIPVLLLLLIIVVIIFTFQNMQRRETTITNNQRAQNITATALSKTETAIATATAGIATAQANIAATQTTIATVQSGNAAATTTAMTAIASQQGEYAVTNQSHPLTIKEGQTFHISFTLQNRGNNTWSDQNGYHLQCIDSDTSAIPCDSSSASWCSAIIKPNQSCTFTVTMQAPTHAGKYKALWQLQRNSQSVAPQDKPYMFIFIIVD